MKSSRKEITNFNILDVMVSSTGYKGGDAGAGGKTILRLQDRGSTVWNLRYENRYQGENTVEQPGLIEIEFQGDSELQTFIEALEFATVELKKIRDAKSS